MWGFFSVLCCQKYLFSEDEIHKVQENSAVLGHPHNICKLCNICLSSRSEYHSFCLLVCFLNVGSCGILDAFQLLKKEQIL